MWEELPGKRLFLNGEQRQALSRLHAFVQAAYQPELLPKLVASWQAYSGATMRELEVTSEDEPVVVVAKRMARLKIIYGFEVAWIDAFLLARLKDTKPQKFRKLADSLRFVHGNAEVLGLVAALILRLPKEAQASAQLQARAFQWLAFVRDMADDADRGYCYFPQEDFKACGLKAITYDTARTEAFHLFVQLQVSRYHVWQTEAQAGLTYLSRRERAALQTVIDGYHLAARRAAKQPALLFVKKPTPGRLRHVLNAVAHSFD